MNTKELIELVRKTSQTLEINPDLAVAICGQESDYSAWKVRYEERWQYFVTPDKFAKILGITMKSEIELQKFSWGPMQVMGSVAREMGFVGYLTELATAEVGIFYGCMKLLAISRKYTDQADIIAAYNAGNAKKVNGNYPNRKYVAEVQKRILVLKSTQ